MYITYIGAIHYTTHEYEYEIPLKVRKQFLAYKMYSI